MVKMWDIIDEYGVIVGNVGSFVLKLMITSHSPSYIFVTCVTDVGVGVEWYIWLCAICHARQCRLSRYIRVDHMKALDVVRWCKWGICVAL